MKTNMGNTDRIIRVILAAVLLMLIYVEILTGPFMWIMGTVSIIFLGTSIVGFCPLYKLVGINTCSSKLT